MRLLSRAPELIPCKLSPLEFEERAGQLARELTNRRELLAEQALRKKEMKLAVDELEAKIGELSHVVATREEERLIEVETKADDTTGKVCIIRLDTGEVIRERNMTAEERQISAELH